MNTIKVLDEDNNELTCEVIKFIKNEEINKIYVVYKDKEDILVSQLVQENNQYQIYPVLDNEWDFIEKKLNEE